MSTMLSTEEMSEFILDSDKEDFHEMYDQNFVDKLEQFLAENNFYLLSSKISLCLAKYYYKVKNHQKSLKYFFECNSRRYSYFLKDCFNNDLFNLNIGEIGSDIVEINLSNAALSPFNIISGFDTYSYVPLSNIKISFSLKSDMSTELDVRCVRLLVKICDDNVKEIDVEENIQLGYGKSLHKYVILEKCLPPSVEIVGCKIILEKITLIVGVESKSLFSKAEIQSFRSQFTAKLTTKQNNVCLIPRVLDLSCKNIPSGSKRMVMEADALGLWVFVCDGKDTKSFRKTVENLGDSLDTCLVIKTNRSEETEVRIDLKITLYFEDESSELYETRFSETYISAFTLSTTFFHLNKLVNMMSHSVLDCHKEYLLNIRNIYNLQYPCVVNRISFEKTTQATINQFPINLPISLETEEEISIVYKFQIDEEFSFGSIGRLVIQMQVNSPVPDNIDVILDLKDITFTEEIDTIAEKIVSDTNNSSIEDRKLAYISRALHLSYDPEKVVNNIKEKISVSDGSHQEEINVICEDIRKKFVERQTCL